MSEFLAAARRQFVRQKGLAERALAQVPDTGLRQQLDPEANSLAVLVKHLAGNLRSRWTAFLATDGEKPDRRRDGEFVLETADSRDGLQERWEEAWRLLFDTLDALTPDDLTKTVRIRGEPLSVPEAIQRQLAHAAYHVGQIIQLARHVTGGAWRTLSIPRGASEQDFRTGESGSPPRPS